MSKPKVRTRDREKTRAQILDAAFREIYARGYHGVGVRELASKADVTIGAFFHYFPTKTLVAHAIIDEVVRDGILDRWIKPLSSYRNPLQGILKCFKSTFDTWPDELVRLGCPLNNLTQELSASEPSVREKTTAVLSEWMDQTKLHLDRAKADGYLKAGVNTRELAEFIVTFQEGTFAMGKALGDRKIFESMYRNFKHHIDSVAV